MWLYGIIDVEKQPKGFGTCVKYGLWDCKLNVKDSHCQLLKNYYMKYHGGFRKLKYHGYGKLYYPNKKLFINGIFHKGYIKHIYESYDSDGNLLLKNIDLL